MLSIVDAIVRQKTNCLLDVFVWELFVIFAYQYSIPLWLELTSNSKENWITFTDDDLTKKSTEMKQK